MKLIQALLVILVVLIGGFFAINSFIYNEKQGGPLAQDIKDLTFVVDGALVTLADGVSEAETAPGSASKTVTRYFGNEVTHDIDGDGDDDVVFLVTQETGGSGTFYYAVGAVNTGNGYEGTQALFIGDRIAPQTTNVGNGRQVVVNYADRAEGESFTEQPSVGKSLYLLYDAASNSFAEVDPDFSGEATTSALAEAFATRIFEAGTSDGLIPIEGFDAGLLLAEFPGFTAEDFDRVEALQGYYELEDGDVQFVFTAEAEHSAARTVSPEGYETLLENVAMRLDMPVQTEFSIDAIVTELYGKGAGSVTLNEVEYVGGIAIAPQEVTEDSRCPSDAECVWEGTLKLNATVDGQAVELELSEPTEVNGYTVTLTQVLPYPETGRDIAADEYQFTFIVEPNE